jgi:SAM-dependent methyltransferase
MSGFDPSTIAASYDRVADEYARVFGDELDRKPADRELLTAFAERNAGRGLVADIGCGPAQIGRYLAARGVTIVGVDLSFAMVAEARRGNPSMPATAADMRALPVRDAGWAGAVAFYSLIHLPREQIHLALTEFRRAVSPGGPLLVALHAGTGEVSTQQMVGRPVELRATFFQLDEIIAAFTSAGFAVEQAIERAPYEDERTSRLYVLGT